MTQESASGLTKTISIDGYQARVMKPVALSKCSRCQWIGHKASLPDCPARAPPEVSDSIQVFCGGADPLSNLHMCPEGCTWTLEGVEYDSVEKEFQNNKLLMHDLQDDAGEILEFTNSMEIMQHSWELIQDKSEAWTRTERMVMEFACKNKFNNCSHVRHVLICSKADLVKGTANRK